MRHIPSFVRFLPFVLVSGVVLVAASTGCSGGGVTDDCQRICSAVTGCYGAASLVDSCTSSCLDRAGGVDAGPVAAAVVRGCAECVSTQTCVGLAAGACNASCPTGSVSTTPGAPPSSSDGCEQSMPLEAATGQVSCERSGRDYFCKCYEDGVRTDSFTSLDFCTASASARTAQMVKACGW